MLDIKRMSWRCVHDSEFYIDRPEGYDTYLMVFVTTPAFFIIDGKRVITEPGTFIIYNKHSAHRYGALAGNEYSNAWAEFELDDINSVVPASCMDKPVYIGESIDVSQYFRLLSDCFFNSNNKLTELHIIKALLSEIFSASREEKLGDVPHFRELLELRQDIYSHPEKPWTIELMSSIIHISKPYFQSLYKQAFGVTCMADVINSRIVMAKSYLGDSSMSIDEIGLRCGYKSPVHLSRQFKQVTGMSPSKWK